MLVSLDPYDTEDAAAEHERERWRLLLVDDEPVQRLTTECLLRRAGYLVESACNGREALEKLQSGRFSLLITDWDMPELDGVALCRALRQMRLDGYIYTILLTGHDAIEDIVAGLQAGADDYLTKPMSEAELVARLNTGKRIVTLERSLRAANEKNRQLSITDPLTGAYNRRHFMEQLPRELERAARCARPLSLVMCDIDHFKSINDTYGHQGGDQVLQQFVHVLQRYLRTAVDWVARYGGEEFLLLLPETRFSAACAVAEGLRLQTEREPCTAGERSLHVTASFGAVGWESAVPIKASLDELIARCDQCVYASKSAGRNRVTAQCLDGSAEPQPFGEGSARRNSSTRSTSA